MPWGYATRSTSTQCRGGNLNAYLAYGIIYGGQTVVNSVYHPSKTSSLTPMTPAGIEGWVGMSGNFEPKNMELGTRDSRRPFRPRCETRYAFKLSAHRYG